MTDPRGYDIHLDVKHGPLTRIDIPGMAAACTKEWFNQSLCLVNDCVVRLGIFHGEFHWHAHAEEDEMFLVLEGRLLIDLRDRTVECGPHQAFTVPRGVEHRTRAPERTVVVMMEKASIRPTGDDDAAAGNAAGGAGRGAPATTEAPAATDADIPAAGGTSAVPAEKSFHMTPEEFRKHGREVVDWIAGYMERIESFPVQSQVPPGRIRSLLPPGPPVQGEPFEAILADMDRVVLPGITHWQAPSFFAYFPANTSGPAILGDLLSSGLGVQGMLWATSPACTEVETHVLDWLVDMLALPDRFRSNGPGGGVIQDTASSASLCAILAARERATGLASNQFGCDGRLTAYASTQAHSSVEKGIRIAGIGHANLRAIGTDADFAMRPDILAAAIEADRRAGRVPFFVSATTGTTSSNAFDPLPEIGRICRENGLWLHVDGAMSGTAALCPEFRWIHRGLELADSYCFNPHKWMFTNFDCDCFWVADRKALITALSILPEYLRNKATESGAVIDYRDWHVPLGRRFRALKLWFVIRHYGVEGLRHHVRRHVAIAQEFASRIRADDRFELAVEPPLNLVCFRHKGGDAANQRIMDRLNASGDLYLTHTRLDEKLTLRFSIAGTYTERRHVERAWARIREEADRL